MFQGYLLRDNGVAPIWLRINVVRCETRKGQKLCDTVRAESSSRYGKSAFTAAGLIMLSGSRGDVSQQRGLGSPRMSQTQALRSRMWAHSSCVCRLAQ